MEKEKKVPIYTKVGWVVSWTLMIVIFGMILRNCAGSFFYGPKTDQIMVDQYYQQGIEDGRKEKAASMQDPVFENPIVRKSYNKGFREGMDAVRKK